MLTPVLLGITIAATPVVDDAIIVPTTALQEQVETRADDWALAIELPDLGQVQCRLERHRITSSSTRFVLGSKQGPDRVLPFNPESVRILSGSIEGLPGSHVSLVATGEHLRGRITLADGRVHRLRAPIDVPVARPGQRPPNVPLCGLGDAPREPVEHRGLGGGTFVPRRYNLQLAVETDWEYRQLFDSVDDAAAYVVFAYGLVSDIFERETGAGIELTYVRIWDTPDDLFDEESPLQPFRQYWNQNMGSVQRSLAQFFSGRRNFPYGGAAYISGICTNHGYSVIGYVLGFSGDIEVPGVDNYDVHVAAHEIGHNCGTYHTHDYGLDDCNDLHAAPLRGPIMSYCSQTTSGGQAVTDVRFHAYTRNIMRNYFIDANADKPECFPTDCNGNMIPDTEDIFLGGSADVNLDGTPDECQDCNGNGTLDPQDIADGSSDDVNGNGLPDECEPDCNGNGVPDAYDIELGTSIDAWGNEIPDECDTDCDGDGMADYTQIQETMELDLDRDLSLDSCQDCDGDGTIDLDELDGAWSTWVGSIDGPGEVGQFHSIVGTRTGAVTEGSVNAAWEVRITQDKRILVTSTIDGRVVEFDEHGNWVQDLVPAGSGLSSPTGLAILPQGSFLVSSTGTNEVLEYDLATGDLLGVFASGDPWDFIPLNILLTTDGRVLVAMATGAVEAWDISGKPLGTFINKAENGNLVHPRGIEQIVGGDILIASMGTNLVLRYDGKTGEYIGVFNDGGTEVALTMDEPWGVRLGPDGNVYISRHGAYHDDDDDGHHDEDSGDIFDEDEDTEELHINATRIYIFEGSTGIFIRSYITGHDTDLWEPTGFDFMPGDETDCNLNARPDACDIASGFSGDVDGDGIPDECQCDADLDGDGTVGVSDLLVVLAEWGPCPLCQGDLDADGHVGVNDLLVVISSWGSCN